jgi:hypothetical protein
MSHRHNRTDSKAREARYASALARPELRSAPDGFTRAAPSSPTSAPVKVQDEATRKMIADAVEKKRREMPPDILMAG